MRIVLRAFWLVSLFALPISIINAKRVQQITESSPNGKTVLTVRQASELTWEVTNEGDQILMPSAISMTINGGKILCTNAKITGTKRRTVNTSFNTPFYKKSIVEDKYKELTLLFSGGYSVQFRVYDEGVAYRFITTMKESITVHDEQAEFNFNDDYTAFIPYVNDNRSGERYCYSFESYYDEKPLSQMFRDSLAIAPLLVNLPNGKKAAIMDCGLEDYAGMFIMKNPEKSNSLKGVFAHYPEEGFWGGYMQMNYIPTKRADYIAQTDGNRTFPWRAIVISTEDRQLADNDMAQKLAQPCRLKDTSWIKPGKVAWDWWNTCNLKNVDFKAGMNTATYKYFIDFAAANHLEYIIIDCGWSGTKADWKGETLMNCTSDINLKEVVAHGNEKGVGVILWASWALCDKEKEIAFPHYAKMGIKGFKVDFLDADDQKMIRSMSDIVKVAADNKLLIDLHGMHPTGIQRTYPNVVNFEGVKGLENTKWAAMDGDKSKDDFLRYDVTIPYIRMMAGPLDYTPGAMKNAQRHMFRPINDHPMSQGTRVHQMAMYIVYEAPLEMLADSPSAYMENQECTDFIAGVPTVFDETKALNGEVGEYITIARRKGDTWWIGSMTNWEARDLTIDLSALKKDKNYLVEVFADGVNSDMEGTDYKKEAFQVTSASILTIHLAPGGGWAAKIIETN